MSVHDLYRIRSTEPRDIPDLYRVRASTRQNAISEEQLLEWGITPRSIADGLESGGLVGRVCEHDGRIVGFCSGDTATGEVIVLAVLPGHEGKGVGSSLLERVVQELSKRGHERVWLACSPDPGSRSHGFYRGNGWIATGDKSENGDDILERHPSRVRSEEHVMQFEKIAIGGIPAIIWGAPAAKAYVHVHGKMSRKEEAQEFAEIACSRGYQVVSFDLPEHGERTDPEVKCDVWNGMRDLTAIHDYARGRWAGLSLFGCSLGAFFSLLAFKDESFEKCLFHSPVLDMERLIVNMMKWFGTNEAELEEKREIPTPMGETLSWKYYAYVKENRVTRWSTPTRILCGTNDNLTERAVFEDFARRFACELEIVENGNHYFTTPDELAALRDWYRRNI